MPIIQSGPELADNLGLSWEELREEARTAGSRYHVYPLLMGKKKRWIEAPESKLKALQRRLLDRVLYRLKPTRNAHGFIKGRSIVSNATEHCGREWVISLDIKDFFPSVGRDKVLDVLSALSAEGHECEVIADLVTRRGRLPQGAPTSPHLANLVVRSLDRKLDALAKAFNWSYTRYADDMSFSGDVKRSDILSGARELVQAAGFQLSDRKTTVRGQHQRQVVTGLVVNEKVALPRGKRRLLRAMLHKLYRRGEVDKGDITSLATINGHLAFLAMVSPDEFAQQRTDVALLLEAGET